MRSDQAGAANWLSRDPIEEEGGANLFCYVDNSPITFIDPYGLEPVNIYTTNAFGIPWLNHVYAEDPVTGETADMHGSSGHTCGVYDAERRRGDRLADAINIPGMSGAEAIRRIRKHIDDNAHSRLFWPPKNDCHTALKAAIENLDGKYDPSKAPRVHPATPKRKTPPRPANPVNPPHPRPKPQYEKVQCSMAALSLLCIAGSYDFRLFKL